MKREKVLTFTVSFNSGGFKQLIFRISRSIAASGRDGPCKRKARYDASRSTLSTTLGPTQLQFFAIQFTPKIKSE